MDARTQTNGTKRNYTPVERDRDERERGYGDTDQHPESHSIVPYVRGYPVHAFGR